MLEDVLQDQCERPSVEKQQVEAPEKDAPLLGKVKQRETHQRRFAQREWNAPVGFDALGQRLLLLRGRQSAKVRLAPRKLNRLQNDLNELFDVLRDEGGPEHGMPGDHAFPGGSERSGVQALLEAAAPLKKGRFGVARVQAVEQHPLLHRRKGIDVLDVLRLNGHDAGFA